MCLVLTVTMVMLPGQKADPGLWSVSGFDCCYGDVARTES